VWLLVLAIALPSQTLLAQQPPVERTRSDVATRVSEKADSGPQGRLFFAGIGIDDYDHPELWYTLDNAVNDVAAVRETLMEEYGFENRPDWVLLAPNTERSRIAPTPHQPTKEGILTLIDSLKQEIEPNDSLVFFFAGHGTEVPVRSGDEVVGQTGYIVPMDAAGTVEEKSRQYLRLEPLLVELGDLQARHVFVILDSCKSGLSLTGLVKAPSRGSAGSADDLMTRKSRRVMTSATAMQDAADGGRQAPRNSRFTGWLVEALKRASDGEEPHPAGDDDLLTATELFTFVQERVRDESNDRQVPDFGTFTTDNGELVLTIDRDPFEVLFERAVELFNDAQFAEVPTAVAAALLEGEDEGFREDFLRYLLAKIADNAGRMRTYLRLMHERLKAGEPIPSSTGMSRGELVLEAQRIESFCNKNRCDPG